MVALVLVFKGNLILFSRLAILIYIPTNSVGGLPSLHTPSGIYCCRFLNDGYFDWCEVISQFSFDLHFSSN